MFSRLSMIIAGALSIISAWMPWVSVMGISQNGFHGDAGNPGLFFVILGVLIALMGLLNKKWSAVLAALFSICVLGLGAKYYGDATSLGATAGSGIYLMIAGGVLGVIGGIGRLFAKKKAIA